MKKSEQKKQTRLAHLHEKSSHQKLRKGVSSFDEALKGLGVQIKQHPKKKELTSNEN